MTLEAQNEDLLLEKIINLEKRVNLIQAKLERLHSFTEYKHKKTGIVFVWIPAGEFEMGHGGTKSNEQPSHTVSINEFLISKYEITQEQWQKIMNTTPWDTPFKMDQEDHSVNQGNQYPASNIPWIDAQEFCRRTGLRLPSEAEWEYACRAGSRSKFYWGNEMDDKFAWYGENAKDEGIFGSKVGEKTPNKFGLYDMSGNVWEWSQDHMHPNYSGAPNNGSAWEEGQQLRRIRRGGSWYNDKVELRSANRSSAQQEEENPFTTGFRVAFSLITEE